MKVGTDGVLLGAWANVCEADRILDVGCGCGLIALMAAQRNRAARVVGVELDAAAAADALANVQHSPFRVKCRNRLCRRSAIYRRLWFGIRLYIEQPALS